MKIPRIPALCLTFATCVLCARAQDSAAPASQTAMAPAQTEMQKWIATTDAQWQAAYERDVSGAHEAEMSKLKLHYQKMLEEAVAKASKASDLDGAVALRKEQKRFGDTPFAPEQDEAGDNAAVKQVRARIHVLLANSGKDNAARAKVLLANYDQVLAKAQAQLTQRQRLDDALLVKAKREQVAAAWGVPVATGSATPAPPAPLSKATPSVPAPTPLPIGARLAENMQIYASGNDNCTI